MSDKWLDKESYDAEKAFMNAGKPLKTFNEPSIIWNKGCHDIMTASELIANHPDSFNDTDKEYLKELQDKGCKFIFDPHSQLSTLRESYYTTVRANAEIMYKNSTDAINTSAREQVSQDKKITSKLRGKSRRKGFSGITAGVSFSEDELTADNEVCWDDIKYALRQLESGQYSIKDIDKDVVEAMKEHVVFDNDRPIIPFRWLGDETKTDK